PALRPPPRATLFPYTTLFRSAGGIGATYGFAKGVVASVSPYPVDPATVQALTANTSLADVARGLGPIREVIVALTPSSTPSGLADRKSTRLNSSHVKISYAVF